MSDTSAPPAGFKVTDCGLVPTDPSKRSRRAAYSTEEAGPHPEEIQAAEKYMEANWVRPSLPHSGARQHSYSLKHAAEEFSGRYVSNGALIQAAINLGFRVVTSDPAGINALIYAVSPKEKRAAQSKLQRRLWGQHLSRAPRH